MCNYNLNQYIIILKKKYCIYGYLLVRILEILNRYFSDILLYLLI